MIEIRYLYIPIMGIKDTVDIKMSSGRSEHSESISESRTFLKQHS